MSGEQINLIVNADDFGRCRAINDGVALASASGILTSTSLMVTGDAFDEAVKLARSWPHIAVGLHLALTGVQPTLPPRQMSRLVNRSTGRFHDSAAMVGWRIFWSKTARQQAADEIAAQFDRFARTGLRLSHVDGHEHLHMHPVMLDIVLPLAQRHGAAGVRLVREPLPGQWPGRSGRVALRQAFYAGVFAWLGARGRRRLRQWPPLLAPDRTYGLMHTGQMSESVVLKLIEQIGHARVCNCVEMYFHPAVGPRIDALGPNSSDLQTLLSPRVKCAIASAGIALSTYPAMAARRSKEAGVTSRSCEVPRLHCDTKCA